VPPFWVAGSLTVPDPLQPVGLWESGHSRIAPNRPTRTLGLAHERAALTLAALNQGISWHPQTDSVASNRCALTIGGDR
jgi:hypothetical protein